MGQHRYGETDEQREVLARIIDYRRKPHKLSFKRIAETFNREKIKTKQGRSFSLQLIHYLYLNHAAEILTKMAGSL